MTPFLYFGHCLAGFHAAHHRRSRSCTQALAYVNLSGLPTTYSFNLSAVPAPLVYRRVAARIRAANTIGAVEAQTDGVLLVPQGPSPGKVRPCFKCDVQGEESDQGGLVESCRVW
jgi:hypothetical protein